MKRKHWNHHRHTLFQALEQNGGYPTRREHYLLEWCLPVYTNKDFDALLLLALVTNAGMDPAVIPVWRAAYAEELGAIEGAFEGWVNSPNNDTNECMWDSFKDDDHYCRHPTSGKKFDCEWALEGRNGKHLVLKAFEGRETIGDAAEMLGLGEGCDPEDTRFSNEQCRNLTDMIAFWGTTLTQERVTDEYECHLAYHIYRMLDDGGMV